MRKRALTMEFVGQEILRLKIPEHDYYSDNDVWAHSHSDSDILATIEKGRFCQMLGQQ